MKKHRMILLLAAALLLIGCGNDPQTPPDASETSAPTSAPAIEAVNRTDTTVSALDAENRIPVEPWLYAPETGDHMLWETKDVQLSITFSRAPYNEVEILFCGRNQTDRELDVRITDVVLNGKIMTDVEAHFSIPKNGTECKSAGTPFKTVCKLVGFENIRELSATVSVKGYPAAAGPMTCSVRFPEGIRLCYLYDTYLDMRADRQLLRADDDVTIALLGCGCFLNDSCVRKLSGVLWIENRGSEPIPVTVSNVSVGGMVVEQFCTIQTLKPNASCLLEFSVQEETLNASGIRSIDSLSLQIMTSDAENTGGHFRTGGAWYPVLLTYSGVAAEPGEEGTVVYEDDLLRMSFIQTKVRYYEWKPDIVDVEYLFLVENRRTEGISVNAKEPTVDGKPYVNARNDYNDTHVRVTNGNLGPQSRGYTVFSLTLPAADVKDRVPTFSFLLQVLSQGKDTVFYTAAEPIVLTDCHTENN